MRSRIHRCSIALALASMLPGGLLAQSSGTMGLTITLRTARASAHEAVSRQSTDLPSSLANGLQRLEKELEDKYDRHEAGRIFSLLRHSTLVVAAGDSPRPVHLPSHRPTELRCDQRKCESL